MKILKYISLLLLLSFVSFSVFIATQKGVFNIQKSKVIPISKNNLYSYVNDYQNWGDFMMIGDKIKIHYSKNNVGKGAKCTWESNQGNGTVQTLSTKENNSIYQKMNIDGTEYELTWTLKDTLGGTKIKIKSKGEMSFSYKIYTALHGGASKIIGNIFENSLAKLHKQLVYEINTYKIKVNGLVQKKGTPYLKQSFTSKISSIVKNTHIVFPKMIAFCKANAIELNGKPFIIYHTYDEKNGLAQISFCIPIKEAIISSDGSDILADELEPFLAIKTSLYGDYSHTKEAVKKSISYINRNVIPPDSRFKHLEVFTINKSDSNQPSKWKTEIYFPVKHKNSNSKTTPKVEESVNTKSENNALGI